MDRRDIKSSREDYLEAILIKINELGACRVTDIADQMGYSKASTSVALKKLEDEGCIKREDWRILLTEKGLEIARKVYDRHVFFVNWFKRIGIESGQAEEDACRIEHVLSEETYEKIKNYLKMTDPSL